MSNLVRILGCGSSTGVPRIGGVWGACDPNNPKNRRTRCSILVQKGSTKVLVDSSPDLRQQMLDANVGSVDAVYYTHDHADQAHGIDDLRVLAQFGRKLLPVFADPQTQRTLTKRFGYCFEGYGDYPAILDMCDLEEGGAVLGDDGDVLTVEPFVMHHGRINATGFIFDGKVAYSPDVHNLPEESFEKLQNIDLWIVDALRYRPHPSHSHVEQTLYWIDKVGASRGVLTNLHIDVDYEEVKAMCPDHVVPAYDGLELAF